MKTKKVQNLEQTPNIKSIYWKDPVCDISAWIKAFKSFILRKKLYKIQRLGGTVKERYTTVSHPFYKERRGTSQCVIFPFFELIMGECVILINSGLFGLNNPRLGWDLLKSSKENKIAIKLRL